MLCYVRGLRQPQPTYPVQENRAEALCSQALLFLECPSAGPRVKPYLSRDCAYVQVEHVQDGGGIGSEGSPPYRASL